MEKLATGLIFILQALTAGLAGPTHSPTLLPCDKGWVAYNNYCYWFNNWRWITQTQAANECDNRDASLLYITSQDELNWFKQNVSAYRSPGYWTSLNNIKNSANGFTGSNFWKWGKYQAADTSLVTWNQSPSNDGVANCAGINILGVMADVGCRANMGYICKYVPTGDDVGCPLGWLPTDTSCYWVSNTTDISQRKNWADAKAQCNTLFSGATLMSIDNAQDQQFISGELPYLAQNSRLHWTGLVRRNNAWVYDNGNPVNQSLFNWVKEPDNIAGHENCAVIRMTGAFSDRNCKYSYSNYACKKPQSTYYPSDNIGCGTWIRAGQYCYNFARTKHLSWQKARDYCQAELGDLIKVDSFDKKEWLELQMIDPGNNRVLWTGLNDISQEGNYVWADGTPVNTTYINWNQEPNDYKGNEDCAVIYTSGEYNDITCAAHAAAICELGNQGSCPSSAWLSRPADSDSSLVNCYLLTPYNNVNLTMTQSEAADYCTQQAVSGNAIPALLSVSSQAEKTFIKSTLAKLSNNPYGWWTSLNDKESEGYWAFGDNTLDSSLIDWKGEPSNASPDQDCGFLNWAGAYHQVPCKITIGFICERPATGVTLLGTGGGYSATISAFTMFFCLLTYILWNN